MSRRQARKECLLQLYNLYRKSQKIFRAGRFETCRRTRGPRGAHLQYLRLGVATCKHSRAHQDCRPRDDDACSHRALNLMPPVGADLRRSDADLLAECVTSNVVLGTVASAAYIEHLVFLSQTAALAGFPCIVVQPFQHLSAVQPVSCSASPQCRTKGTFQIRNLSLVRQLSLPAPPRLPRSIWCDANLTNHSQISLQRYGWRRSHLYRTRMWTTILEHGYDLLAIDLDHTFVDLRLVLLKPPGTLLRALRSTRTLHNRTADVIALHDGKSRMMLNVGLIFIRSTPATISLVQRVEKRSFAAWEQAVFNEELNFGEHSIGTGEPDIACCHSERGSACDIGSFLRPLPRVHDMGHESWVLQRRKKLEGGEQCSDTQPESAMPPKRSPYEWRHRLPEDRAGTFSGQGWEKTKSYNDLVGRRQPGHCTALTNYCLCSLPDPPEHDEQQDAIRRRDRDRILRHLISRVGQEPYTVNSSAFHKGMALGWPPRRLPDPNYDSSRPVLLRDWLKPFISMKDHARILEAESKTKSVPAP